jgi:hypothetical protein
MKSITIELMYDLDSDEHEAALIEVGKMCARTLVTQATMLGGRREPKIIMHSASLIFGKEELNINDTSVTG